MITLYILNISMNSEIDIHTVWIPRIENQRADFLSRIIDRRLGNHCRLRRLLDKGIRY